MLLKARQNGLKQKRFTLQHPNEMSTTSFAMILDTLIWLANLAALEIHMPFSKIDALDKPDLLFFDVDPEPPATLSDAAEVALLLKDKLLDLGLNTFR